jgi:hypothetical protein
VPDAAFVPAADSSVLNDKNGVRLHLQGKKGLSDAAKEVTRAAAKMNKRFGSLSKGMFGAMSSLQKSLGVEDGAAPEPSAPVVEGAGAMPPAPPAEEELEARGFEVGSETAGHAARTDYQLQTGIIENELLSALTAHTGYFTNEDFIAQLVREVESQGGFGGGGGIAAEEAAGWVAAPGESRSTALEVD